MHDITLVTKRTSTSTHLAVPHTTAGVESQLVAEAEKQSFQKYGATAKPDSDTRVPGSDAVLISIGCGDSIDFRSYAASAVRASKGVTNLSIDLTMANHLELMAAAEGSLLGMDTPSAYKKSTTDLQTVELVVDEKLLGTDLSASLNLAHRIVEARQIINTPANDLWPAKLAEICATASLGLPL